VDSVIYEHGKRSYAVFIDQLSDDHTVIRISHSGHDKMLGCDTDEFRFVVGRVEVWAKR
jgi:hypothetical protein